MGVLREISPRWVGFKSHPRLSSTNPDRAVDKYVYVYAESVEGWQNDG